MARFFGGLSGMMSSRSATAHARVQSNIGSVSGMRGMTIRPGGGAMAMGFSARKTPTVRINPRNNPFTPRLRVTWNPLSFGSGPPASSGGRMKTGSKQSSHNAKVGANAVRQLIQHYGRVPDEIRKEFRQVLKVGGLQLARRAGWYWRMSSRAQRAIKVSTSLGWKNAGTRVWVDRNIMPFNRAWERIMGENYYMHVPWGNYDAIHPRSNRPALRPATRDVGPRIIRDVNRQLVRTINRFQRGKV